MFLYTYFPNQTLIILSKYDGISRLINRDKIISLLS